jgi:hypothetical protein
MPLTDRSYLLVTPQAMHVVDQQSGRCAISLQHDANLLGITIAEILRQKLQLANAIESGQEFEQFEQSAQPAEAALGYLDQTNELFKGVPLDTASHSVSFVPGGMEVFPSVCMTADGTYLVIRRDGGQNVYLDSANWYSDLGQSPLNEAYPLEFRSIAVSYLSKMIRDSEATQNMLLADKEELATHMTVLGSELRNYEASTGGVVNFGTRQIAREEAIRLTQLAMRKTERQIQTLNKHLEELPGKVDIARATLDNVKGERKA